MNTTPVLQPVPEIQGLGPDDTVFDPEQIARWQEATRKFTMDTGAYTEASFVSRAAGSSLPRTPFLKEDCRGHHIWADPPPNKIFHVLSHINEERARAPTTTSACILVPRWIGGSAWRKGLKGWRLLHEYPARAMLYIGREDKVPVEGVPHSKQLWYCPREGEAGELPGIEMEPWVPQDDEPRRRVLLALPTSQPKDDVTLTYLASLGGIGRVRVLLDSGAAGNFITKDAAKNAPGNITRIQNQMVHGAGGGVRIRGRCAPRLVMQGYRGTPTLYVLDALPGGYDVVLGDQWLKEQEALVSFGEGRCVLQKHHPAVILTREVLPEERPDDFEEEEASGDSGGESEPRGGRRTRKHKKLPFKTKLLTSIAFRRAAAGAARTFAIMVVKKPFTRTTTTPVPILPEDPPQVWVTEDDDSEGEQSAKGKDVVPPDVQKVLDQYACVFADIPAGLPPKRNNDHCIPTLPGAMPPHKRMYRLSPREKEEVEKQVGDLLQKGWIVPSPSPYGAPVIFAQKKDGTLRMCIDYRALNKQTVKNRYPLPRIDDLLDMLHGATVFSSLDLQSGFHQIRISPEDSEKTGFLTHQGLYQYKVLCFGVSNAPSTFQSVMNEALAPVLGKTAMVYMDDILVYSKNREDHPRHLAEVLELLKKHQLYAKMSKCSFAQVQTNFLGHVVSAEGISVDPKKIKVLKEWPRPQSVDHVRSFLGLATYFRKFCKDFATKAHALHLTLRKPKKGEPTDFAWGPEQETAFRSIIHALTHAPILRSPDLEVGAKPFHVVCDASGVGLGAILMQDGHPVAYESRKMLPAERNYGVGEQELLAVVHAMRTWRCYLEGVKSVVVTDHNPNTYLQTQPMLSRRQVRWSEYLQNFDFDWLYKPGPQNPADPLSRMPQYTPEKNDDLVELAKKLGRPLTASIEADPILLMMALTMGEDSKEPLVDMKLLLLSEHLRKKAPEDTGRAYRQAYADQCVTGYPLLALSRFTHSRQCHDPANLHLLMARRSERIKAALEKVPESPVVPAVKPLAKRPAKRVRFTEPEPQVPTERGVWHTEFEGEGPVEGIGEPKPVLREETLAELCRLGYERDPWFKNTENLKGLTRRDGLYLREGKTVVPGVGSLRQDILAEEHDTPFGGHQGIDRTFEKIDRAFWWPTLRKDVGDYVHTCHKCQRSKAGNQPPSGMLQSLDVPERRWSDVSMDFITALPLSERGNTQIVVFVDRLTKMVHLDALPEKATAPDVARCFMRNVFRLHGMPERLVTDRDSKFMSDFWTEVMRMLGTKRRMSTAYHPQTDGQTERYNTTLEDMLRHWVNPQQDNWDTLLECAEFATNNSYCTSTRDTPFRLNYGQDPLTPLSVELDTRLPVARDFVGAMTESLRVARLAMAAAQSRHKFYYDKGRKHAEFLVGSKVLLRTTNLSFRGKVARKLMPKWVGPFEVVKRVGELAYQLRLPAALPVHDVFHVELLKGFREGTRYQPPPIPVDVDGHMEYVIEEVIQHRYRRRGKRPPASEYLVKWAGYGEEHNSWEPEDHVEETIALTRFIERQTRKGAWPPPKPVSSKKKSMVELP